MLKHFVEFWYLGSLFSEHFDSEIGERIPELVTVPDKAYAYRFYDQEQEVVDGKLIIGENKNYSGFTYFGKIYTLEEVKEQFPEYGILIGNMERNNWTRVVHTCSNTWNPLEEADTVIEQK